MLSSVATGAEIETLVGAPSSVSGADATRASTTVPRPLVPVAPAPTPNTLVVSGPSASGRVSGYELVPPPSRHAKLCRSRRSISGEARGGEEWVRKFKNRWGAYK